MYSLSNFQILNRVLLTIVAMLYITSRTSVFYDWTCVPFDSSSTKFKHNYTLNAYRLSFYTTVCGYWQFEENYPEFFILTNYSFFS